MNKKGHSSHHTVATGDQMMPYASMHQNKEMSHHRVEEMKDFCHKHRYHYVIMEMNDGQYYDGIIMDIDHEHVHLFMPIGEEHQSAQTDYNDDRQFGFGPSFGRFPFRFRRFHPFFFPFFGIRRFFFPFFF
ncbi:MAG TPA: hypothetical protein VIG73_01825 [Cerasibacillus sp.]|uniref:hypothetical protein n=1 Tax=Cerasibacillus sp. TaxID=2498711 RepID=UPI002F3ED5FF